MENNLNEIKKEEGVEIPVNVHSSELDEICEGKEKCVSNEGNVNEQAINDYFTVNDKRFWKNQDAENNEKTEEPTTKVPSYIQELKDTIEKKEKILKEYIENRKAEKLQDQQEIEAFRKRYEKDMEKRVKKVKADFVSDLLEVLDNFERSFAIEINEKNYKSFYTGVEYIFKQIFTTFKKSGIEKIDILNKSFDPNVAEALDVIYCEEADKDNVVLEVVQNGYQLGDLVIRPAKVRVAKFSAAN